MGFFINTVNDTKIKTYSYCFLASAIGAAVDGESFNTTDEGGFVRALETMNSESANDFRWSVRLTAGYTYIGVATKLPDDEWIEHNDVNAIIYEPYGGKILEGKTMVKKIISAKNGDEIHFRFQPKLKKFSISFVSSIILDCFIEFRIYLEFQKDEEHAVDIKEGVDYFPVIQGHTPGSSATLFKPEQ